MMRATHAGAGSPQPGTQLDNYEILMPIAAGGMASVHAARTRGAAGFERLVAIKSLHPHLADQPEYVRMFLDEARLGARIHHPNVVATHDVKQGRDGYLIVMEYVAGTPFGALVRAACERGERIDPRVVARIVVDALNGLQAAHTLTDQSGEPLGLVHRDVSPNNLIVARDGTTKLTDFGVAKADGRLSVTEDGKIKGKLSYLAPEYIAGNPFDQRVDLFAMGVVLWEALAGRRLFYDESPHQTLDNIRLSQVPPPSREVPGLKALDEVVRTALAKDPKRRFRSAEEMALALERAALPLGGVAHRRQVAATIERLLGPQLQDEDARIRASAVELDRVQSEPPRAEAEVQEPATGSRQRAARPTKRSRPARVAGPVGNRATLSVWFRAASLSVLAFLVASLSWALCATFAPPPAPPSPKARAQPDVPPRPTFHPVRPPSPKTRSGKALRRSAQ